MDKLLNKHFDDCYFSSDNGYKESYHVFYKGNSLEESDFKNLTIGETGFGTGLNLLVLEDQLKNITDGNITFTSVEKYPLEPKVVEDALNMLDDVTKESLKRHMDLYCDFFYSLSEGWNKIQIKREWGTLIFNIFIGDILDSFLDYPERNKVWFLDGHSPDKNPEMWSLELFKHIGAVSMEDATFATFTAAGVVKRALREAGFFVKRSPGFGKKRHMIRGTYLSF